MINKYAWVFLALALVVSGFSWPWQEQPKKDDGDVVTQQRPLTSEREPSILEMNSGSLETAFKETRGKNPATPPNMPSFIDQKAGQSNSPSDAAGTQEKADRLVTQINKINKLQRISGGGGIQRAISAASLSKISTVGSVSEYGDLAVTSSEGTVKLPRVQNQVNDIVDLHKKIKTGNQAGLGQLQDIIELTRSHEKILDELEKMNAKDSEVTVVDEEEILRQEMIRIRENAAQKDGEGQVKTSSE